VRTDPFDATLFVTNSFIAGNMKVQRDSAPHLPLLLLFKSNSKPRPKPIQTMVLMQEVAGQRRLGEPLQGTTGKKNLGKRGKGQGKMPK
jgi:hypothetical protein